MLYKFLYVIKVVLVLSKVFFKASIQLKCPLHVFSREISAFLYVVLHWLREYCRAEQGRHLDIFYQGMCY